MVNDTNLNRDEIARQGGSSTTGTMRREEPVGQKMKEGWRDFKAKVRAKWSQLTDKDVDTYHGRSRNDFVGYVHGKVGGDRSLVERDVDTFARDARYRWD
jgi:uncharacterized protein YjbJ (UPF0337 family)